MVKESIKFSEVEAAVGADYARRKHHFPIDKPTLRKRADLVLKKMNEYPHLRPQEFFGEVLSDIHFSERGAYTSGICKMLSERNPDHHKIPA